MRAGWVASTEFIVRKRSEIRGIGEDLRAEVLEFRSEVFDDDDSEGRRAEGFGECVEGDGACEVFKLIPSSTRSSSRGKNWVLLTDRRATLVD